MDNSTRFRPASGSDTEAIGGELAWQYGKYGTLSNVGLAATQAILNEDGFGSEVQALGVTEDAWDGGGLV
jgi:hypothetical protein